MKHHFQHIDTWYYTWHWYVYTIWPRQRRVRITHHAWINTYLVHSIVYPHHIPEYTSTFAPQSNGYRYTKYIFKLWGISRKNVNGPWCQIAKDQTKIIGWEDRRTRWQKRTQTGPGDEFLSEWNESPPPRHWEPHYVCEEGAAACWALFHAWYLPRPRVARESATRRHQRIHINITYRPGIRHAACTPGVPGPNNNLPRWTIWASAGVIVP